MGRHRSNYSPARHRAASNAFARAAFGPVAGMLTLFTGTVGSPLARFLLDTLVGIWPAAGTTGGGIAMLIAIYTMLALVNIPGTRDGMCLMMTLGVVSWGR